MTNPQSIVLFGGTGFIGRTLACALAHEGHNVTILSRKADLDLAFPHQALRGQICVKACNPRSDSAVAEALAGQDIVINLIGTLIETKGQTYQTAHVEIPARLARTAKSMGTKRLIHVSALGSSLHARARYARSKAVGEEAVRAFFPESIILRPSLVFGPEDKFLTKLAYYSRFWPALPMIGGGKTRFQPVYVGDLAKAVVRLASSSRYDGHSFDLVGPQIYSFQDLLSLTLRILGRKRPLISVSWALARMGTHLASWIPTLPFSQDLIDLLHIDNVPDPAAKWPEIARLEDLGIRPVALEMMLPTYIAAFRPAHPQE